MEAHCLGTFVREETVGGKAMDISSGVVVVVVVVMVVWAVQRDSCSHRTKTLMSHTKEVRQRAVSTTTVQCHHLHCVMQVSGIVPAVSCTDNYSPLLAIRPSLLLCRFHIMYFSINLHTIM